MLARIESKYLDKLVETLRGNHFLQGLSKASLQKFVLNGALGRGYGELLLTKVNTIRGMLVYREGEVSDRVYLVIKGEFELARRLHRDVTRDTQGVIDRFGGRKTPPPGFPGH